MSDSLPWSVRGIDPATREAAKAAARRAGMTLAEWLDQVIRGEAEPAPRRRITTTKREAPVTDQRSTRRDTAIRDRDLSPSEIEVLINHAAALEARTRDSEARTTSALESIANWIEKAEARMTASEHSTAARQERATSLIADAIKSIGARVADVERRDPPHMTAPPASMLRKNNASTQAGRAMAGDVMADDVMAGDIVAGDIMGQGSRRRFGRDGVASAIDDIRARQAELAHERRQPGGEPRSGAALHRPEGERRSGPRAPDLTPLMQELRNDIAQMRRDIAALQTQPDPTRLEESIRDLAARIQQPAPASNLDDLLHPLKRIESELATLGATSRQPELASIGHEIAQLSRRVDALAERAQEPRALAAAIKELAGLKDALLDATRPDLVNDLGSRMRAMSEDLRLIRDQAQEQSPIAAIRDSLEDMRDAIGRAGRQSDVDEVLLHRIARQVEDVASGLDALRNADSSGAIELVAEMSRKLDHLAVRTAPESEALASRLDDLVEKLAGLASFDHGRIETRIDQIADQIASLSAAPVATKAQNEQARLSGTALEKQIGVLADRIAELAAPATAQVNLQPLEGMITDLGRRLDEATRPDSSTATLQALERQIATLAERLEAQPAPAASEAAMERTLRDMLRSLGQLRDETTTAVEHATRAALGDLAARQAQPLAALDHLKHDLARLGDVHDSIDARTRSALGEVNSTLEKIVDRLATIEQQVVRAPEPTRTSHMLTPAEQALLEAGTLAREVAHPAAGGWDRTQASGEGASRTAPDPFKTDPYLAEMPLTAATALDRSHQDHSHQGRAPANAFARIDDQEHGRDVAPVSSDLDLPLEPGSGRPAGPAQSEQRASASRPMANPPPGSAPENEARPARVSDPSKAIKASYIAAARRAAQAATSEAAAQSATGTAPVRTPKMPSARAEARPDGTQADKATTASTLREAFEKRRKPILLGLAAVVLALGAGQVADTLLGEARPPVASSPQPTAMPSDRTDPGIANPGRSAPANSTPDARENAAPHAPSPSSRESLTRPDADRQTMAPPASGETASVDITSSTRPARDQIAALPPNIETRGPSAEPVMPSPSPRDGVSRRVTGLDDLLANLGTPGLRKAALEGNAHAVHELAVRALDGTGMTRDPRLAMRLFEGAAQSGHAPSQFRLGNMYEKGIGTTRDVQAAAQWYRKAAERGNARAQHNLAVLLAEGVSGKPDYPAAAALFRQAAEAGIRDSQFNLAILLGRGLGSEQDLMQAYVWFGVAAREGDEDAARKRDEVGTRLSPEDLAAARRLVATWQPKRPDPLANDIATPVGGWDPKPVSTRPPPRPRAT